MNISTPTFFGLTLSTASPKSPRIEDFAQDPSTVASIRWGDPVKQITGGGIVRATPTDTAILGFAAQPASPASYMPTTIPYVTPGMDPAGRPLIPVYVADDDLTLSLQAAQPTAQAQLLKTWDLQYAAAPITPMLATAGTAGSTTYTYQVTAVTRNGESHSQAGTSITTGNAVLSATNYNVLTIPAQSLVVQSVNIYRNGFLIANVPVQSGVATTYNDTGVTATTQTPPSTALNNTGWLVNNGSSSTNILQALQLDTRDWSTIQPEGYGSANGGRLVCGVFQAKSQWLSVAGS